MTGLLWALLIAGGGVSLAMLPRLTGAFLPLWLAIGGGVGEVWKTISNAAVATFTAIVSPFRQLTVAIEPVQSGSGDPSPDNIRPISGWSEAKVTRTGVNVWDEVWEEGTYNASTGQPVANSTAIRSKNYISVKGATSYFAKIPDNASIRYCEYDASKTFIQSFALVGGGEFTTSANARFIRFHASPKSAYNNNISINYPSTDHDYHAYSGNTYTVDLDGTRYGGVLDVLTGVLTVDRAIFDLGDVSWTRYNASGNYIFYGDIADGKKYASSTIPVALVCSCYKTPFSIPASATALGAESDCSIAINMTSASNGTRLLVKDTQYTTKEAFKTAVTGQKVVYELATPTTIQLTAQQVSSLPGANNVWADAGNVTVEYRES